MRERVRERERGRREYVICKETKLIADSSKYMQSGGVFGVVVNVRQGKIFEMCIKKQPPRKRENRGHFPKLTIFS